MPCSSSTTDRICPGREADGVLGSGTAPAIAGACSARDRLIGRSTNRLEQLKAAVADTAAIRRGGPGCMPAHQAGRDRWGLAYVRQGSRPVRFPSFRSSAIDAATGAWWLQGQQVAVVRAVIAGRKYPGAALPASCWRPCSPQALSNGANRGSSSSTASATLPAGPASTALAGLGYEPACVVSSTRDLGASTGQTKRQARDGLEGVRAFEGVLDQCMV